MKKYKRRFFKLAAVCAAVVVCAFFLTSCSQNSGTVFKTSYQINVWGENTGAAVKSAIERITALDKGLSPVMEGSDVYKINAAKANEPISVSSDTVYLMELSKKLYIETERAYNPAIFPVVKLWGFDPANFDAEHTRVPSDEEIATVLPLCDFDFFLLDKAAKTVTKTVDGAQLDFGASAKGYASDAASKFFFEFPDYLINIGGTVLVGSEPKTIGILKPFTEKDLCKVLTLTRAGAATSGTYLRNFSANGILYHHILGKDGKPTGLNEENPVISVSVVGGSAVISDMLSTVGVLLPPDRFESVLSIYNASAYIIYKDNSERFFNGFESFIKE